MSETFLRLSLEGTFSRFRLEPAMGGVLRSLAVVRLAEAAVTFPKSRSCWLSRENGGGGGGGRGGLGPMSAAAGRDGWDISGRKGQKVKGVMG